jgi:CDP-diacylglycerol---serine O-phosphatidyltransferase
MIYDIYIKMKHFPNFITTLNLGSGFIAIIFAANGDINTASWLVLAAMIFDFLDGFSARLLKAYSAVGKELDSLADIVSFGVAPGLIIYNLLINSELNRLFNFHSDTLNSILLMLIPAIMPVCGAIRLAIFNLDSSQSTTFKGLPIPANALGVVSIVIARQYSQSDVFNSITGSSFFLILLTILLSLLMVSRIPLLSLKVTSLKLKGNEGRYILVALVITGFAIFGMMSVPFIIPIYIFSSLISLFL